MQRLWSRRSRKRGRQRVRGQRVHDDVERRFTELASGTFEWIEAFCNPVRRHSSLGYRSPNDFEDLHAAALTAA